MKADHAQVARLLKTARGQIDGILKMVEEDRYCLDVSNQLMATQSILKKANRLVLKAHMNCCVREAVDSGDPAPKLEELAALPYLIGGTVGGWAGGRLFKGVRLPWLKRGFGALLIWGGLRCLL